MIEAYWRYSRIFFSVSRSIFDRPDGFLWAGIICDMPRYASYLDEQYPEQTCGSIIVQIHLDPISVMNHNGLSLILQLCNRTEGDGVKHYVGYRIKLFTDIQVRHLQNFGIFPTWISWRNQNSRNRTAGKRQPEQDSRNRTAGIG